MLTHLRVKYYDIIKERIKTLALLFVQTSVSLVLSSLKLGGWSPEGVKILTLKISVSKHMKRDKANFI